MDQDIRALERAVQADPNDLKARIELFKARLRIDPTGVSTIYKIKHKISGKFLTGSSYINYTKMGKTWKSLDAVYKFISGLSEAQLTTLKGGFEIVEHQTLESSINNNFDAMLYEMKLNNLTAQKSALEAQQAKLLKEIDAFKATNS